MKTKSTAPFQITKEALWEAFKQSERAKVVGVDGQTIEDYARNHNELLHEQWLQLTSGDYAPSPLLRTFIPKKQGGWRPIGIPTVKDFIVQTLLKNELASKLDAIFHPNSYGYVQKRRARADALKMTEKRCLRYDWAVVLDIQKFADSIDHKLLMEMLKKHIRTKWALIYTQRSIKAPVKLKDERIVPTKIGLAQGSKLNILLGNLYMHHIFDEWMTKNHPRIPFERYTDDIVCHCKSEASAKKLLSQLHTRFGTFKLTPHPDKTKIVYCKDNLRKSTYPNVSFVFLAVTFAARKVKSKSGKEIERFLAELSEERVTRRNIRKFR